MIKFQTIVGRLLAALLLLPTLATARDLPLAQPIDCTLGDTCYIQNYVDHDPSETTSNFRCGPLTYDGHKGTDFALPTLADMDAGVDVIAAAPGTVRGVRDGMPDIRYDADGAPDIAGRECGNGVVISHGGGWETQYCHMKEGSIIVAAGDHVTIGTPLGEVGLSGHTQFPHLHLEVRQNGDRVDPFDPDGTVTCDAPDQNTLWTNVTATAPGGVLDSGFATAVPAYDAIKAGTADEDLTTASPAMVFWAYTFGTQANDEITLTIQGPEGEIFTNTSIIASQQALAFRAGGKRTPDGGWPTGTYTGSAVLSRDGTIIGASQSVIILD